MESNLYILIYAWFSNYINNKKPGYSFAAVREHIQFLRFEDTHIIVFLFLNPITHIHEEKRFTTRNILEESKEKTKTLTESLLQNKKITALIHSWLPDMDMVNITNMTIVSHMP